MTTTNDWKPIETAPKDGTEILVGKWLEQRKLARNGWPPVWKALDPIWKQTVASFQRRGKHYSVWCLAEEGSHAEDDELPFEPTHWMPIPPPPKP